LLQPRKLLSRTSVAIAAIQATAFLLVVGTIAANEDRIIRPILPQWLEWSAKALSFPLFYVLPDRVIDLAFPVALVVLALLNGSVWAVALGAVMALWQRHATTSVG
jgi:hypothetical protein